MLRLVSSVVVLLCLSGCCFQDPDIIWGDDQQVIRLTIGEAGVAPSGPRDPVDVEGLSLSGDLLLVNVSYGGGCAEHDFALSWDGSFAESNPTQASLVLLHDAHDDQCRAHVTTTLRFDLTPVKERWREMYRSEHGSTIPHVAGARDIVLYEF
ncbi:hypothetical protein JQX13_24685 [Archangium violaceum]|uniref:hypothetical protein n=1 Tax=Archangium violaceum TaxID=83451 RepID=UPI00193B6100|nr:hypothetical protein [Archangium violaceum]QRK12946.1 hypothetical protein JQX13_24685 [Archangium violaceum]